MSYYQGDFYVGDPGFFSFLGKAVRGIAGVGTSLMPGGSAIQKIASKIGPRGTAIIQRGTAAIVKHPVLSGAAAAGTVGALGAGVGRATGRMGAAGMGKSRMGMGAMVGMGRRHRRMHVTNVKALRRAIRRCTGFAHLAKRVLRFTSPRPPRGRAVFKAKRRKRTV